MDVSPVSLLRYYIVICIKAVCHARNFAGVVGVGGSAPGDAGDANDTGPAGVNDAGGKVWDAKGWVGEFRKQYLVRS